MRHTSQLSAENVSFAETFTLLIEAEKTTDNKYDKSQYCSDEYFFFTLHEISVGASVIGLVSESIYVSQAFCRKSAWSDIETRGSHSFIFMKVRQLCNLKMLPIKLECTFLDLTSSNIFAYHTLEISCGTGYFFVCVTIAISLHFLRVLQHSGGCYAITCALLSFLMFVALENNVLCPCI